MIPQPDVFGTGRRFGVAFWRGCAPCLPCARRLLDSVSSPSESLSQLTGALGGQVRLEDLFKKTKAKPEIFWQQNPPQVRERVLKRLRETSAAGASSGGASGGQASRSGR